MASSTQTQIETHLRGQLSKARLLCALSALTKYSMAVVVKEILLEVCFIEEMKPT